MHNSTTFFDINRNNKHQKYKHIFPIQGKNLTNYLNNLILIFFTIFFISFCILILKDDFIFNFQDKFLNKMVTPEGETVFYFRFFIFCFGLLDISGFKLTQIFFIYLFSFIWSIELNLSYVETYKWFFEELSHVDFLIDFSFKKSMDIFEIGMKENKKFFEFFESVQHLLFLEQVKLKLQFKLDSPTDLYIRTVPRPFDFKVLSILLLQYFLPPFTKVPIHLIYIIVTEKMLICFFTLLLIPFFFVSIFIFYFFFNLSRGTFSLHNLSFFLFRFLFFLTTVFLFFVILFIFEDIFVFEVFFNIAKNSLFICFFLLFIKFLIVIFSKQEEVEFFNNFLSFNEWSVSYLLLFFGFFIFWTFIWKTSFYLGGILFCLFLVFRALSYSKVIYNLIFLIMVFSAISLSFFLILKFDFLGLILLSMYVGGVLVLFLTVIKLLGVEAREDEEEIRNIEILFIYSGLISVLYILVIFIL